MGDGTESCRHALLQACRAKEVPSRGFGLSACLISDSHCLSCSALVDGIGQGGVFFRVVLTICFQGQIDVIMLGKQHV